MISDERKAQLRERLAKRSGPERAGAGERPAGPYLDASVILESVGHVPYTWDIASDALLWGTNAASVLTVPDMAAVATGRLYALLFEQDSATTRYDAVMGDKRRDDGTGVPYHLEYALKPVPGQDTKLWIEDSGRWFAGANGKPARAQGIVRVINERHARDERLSYLSHFDELTGEINRQHLIEILGDTLDEAVRFRASCGFLLIAIDNLARINDCYGYAVADEVIRAVAKRLRERMRGGDTLGRYSGNKFGVVLKSCTPDDMGPAADRLLAAVRDEVVATSVGPVAITITIGGVAAPRHARSVNEILTRAQESLDHAKARQHGSFHAYRPNVEREAMRQENIRACDQIISALNERRVLLAFEPVVAAKSRRTDFYECLMRVRSGEMLLESGAIIPMAERLGLIRLIDHRVLELAVAELAAAPQLKLSVNLSAVTTTDPDWWASLTALLQSNPGAGERLTVEITEMATIHDIDEMRGFVTRVKDLGCRIAIDDFGAGATSFRNLRKLGVDIVKIDGAFVQKLSRSDDDRAFVRAILDLGHALGLTTVAEWVQDEETAATLTQWGCSYLQGALFGLASLDRPWAGLAPATKAGAA